MGKLISFKSDKAEKIKEQADNLMSEMFEAQDYSRMDEHDRLLEEYYRLSGKSPPTQEEYPLDGFDF